MGPEGPHSKQTFPGFVVFFIFLFGRGLVCLWASKSTPAKTNKKQRNKITKITLFSRVWDHFC